MTFYRGGRPERLPTEDEVQCPPLPAHGSRISDAVDMVSRDIQILSVPVKQTELFMPELPFKGTKLHVAQSYLVKLQYVSTFCEYVRYANIVRLRDLNVRGLIWLVHDTTVSVALNRLNKPFHIMFFEVL